VPQNHKTALVLSSGGVFGAYQAGVWKVLANSFQPDLVVGASIGSINGWLIAGGCPPGDLEQLWLNADQHLKIRARLPRHWSQGCMDASGIEGALSDLYRRFPPQTGYAAVVTDLFRRRARIVTSAEMSWRYLLASCAVPGAFDLQRLGGSTYADGGLLGALPLWAAVELGATRIVAVYSQPEPPLPFRLAISAGRALSSTPARQIPQVETITITPEKPLGSFYELLRYRRHRVESWIAQGESDALNMKRSVEKCVARQ
jgi:predicted acylesterase/phospholipase RssA